MVRRDQKMSSFASNLAISLLWWTPASGCSQPVLNIFCLLGLIQEYLSRNYFLLLLFFPPWLLNELEQMILVWMYGAKYIGPGVQPATRVHIQEESSNVRSTLWHKESERTLTPVFTNYLKCPLSLSFLGIKLLL